LINVRFPHNDSKSLILILLYLSNENKKESRGGNTKRYNQKVEYDYGFWSLWYTWHE